MTNFQISVLCLIATLGIYFANKRLYRRFHALPLMPPDPAGADAGLRPHFLAELHW